MRDSNGFDLWADDYDNNVIKIEQSGKYPFAGYRQVLNSIINNILSTPKAKILDLGFGTAPISSELYKQGYEIWGQDFSQKMLEIAQKKMPNARLFLKDFSEGLESNIASNKFDYIIATYSLHHILNNDFRNTFIKNLIAHLNESGKILIGDVMFKDYKERDFCRNDAAEEWDDKENYIIVDELKLVFPSIKFEKFSYCAGFVEIKK